MGALLTSSPTTPYVLESDGQLRKEGTNVRQEGEMESMVKDVEAGMAKEEGLKMETSKDCPLDKADVSSRLV